MKKITASLLTLVLVLCMLPVTAAAASQITLYGLDSWAEEYLTMPSDKAVSYQIDIKGSYQVISGDSVSVSADGLITPRYLTFYWYGGFGTTFPMEGQEPTAITRDCNYGDSVVRVYHDGQYTDLTVTVVNYAEEYANDVMDQYLAAHPTDTMSGREKIVLACQFAAGYDYSVSASGATGMILTGGGDCWASTDAIIKLCKKMGLKAWARNANRDPGAGSGHENVMIEADGTYYEADAGYVGTAPRYYSVTERTSLYSYRYNSQYGGIELYQYDGYETPAAFDVPAEVDGYTVVGIGEKFLVMDSAVQTVRLPSTVRYIANSAFNSCTELTSINLPASLTELGDFVFTACHKLTDITCDPGNEAFYAENGCIYDRDQTVLLYAPAVETVTLPETVTRIADYAFYYNHAIRSITLPATVHELGEGAFGDCTALETVELAEGGLTALPDFAFAYCSSLKKVIVPDSVTQMSEYIFYNGAQPTIYGNSGSYAAQFAAEQKLRFVALDQLPRGDVDEDGFVTPLDALTVLRMSVGLEQTTDAADLDGDGDVTPLDALTVLRISVGLE